MVLLCGVITVGSMDHAVILVTSLWLEISAEAAVPKPFAGCSSHPGGAKYSIY